MKGKFRVRFAVLVFMILFVLGVVGVFASSYGGVSRDGAVGRFVDYGVFPAFSYRNPDIYVTYNGFADIMQNLMSYQIDERYTFASGHMNIRPCEALNILINAGLCQAAKIQENFGYFLTFRELAAILDELIQSFVSGENIVYFEDAIYGTILINFGQVAPNSSFFIGGVRGAENLIIAHNYLLQNNIFINDVEVAENITITGSGAGYRNIIVTDTRAVDLNIVTPTIITFTGETAIENVNVLADVKIATHGLTRGATLPNVNIVSGDVTLFGNFNQVNNYVNGGQSPVLLVADGNIAHVHSVSDILITGDVNVANYSTTNHYSLNIINQSEISRNADIYDLFNQSLTRSNMQFMLVFLDALGEIFGDFNWDWNITLPPIHIPPIQLPTPPPAPTPPIVAPPDQDSPLLPEEPEEEQPEEEVPEEETPEEEVPEEEEGELENPEEEGNGDGTDDEGNYDDENTSEDGDNASNDEDVSDENVSDDGYVEDDEGEVDGEEESEEEEEEEEEDNGIGDDEMPWLPPLL